MSRHEGFEESLARIDGLVRKLQDAADPALVAAAKELVQSIMDLHEAGLERILEIAAEAGVAGQLGSDPLIAGLLILYDLHPDPVEIRVHRAVAQVQPLLRSRGASVEVLRIAEDGVHLRLRSDGGCASTADSLRTAVQEAIYETAPDVAHVWMESASAAPGNAGFVPLQSVGGYQLRES